MKRLIAAAMLAAGVLTTSLSCVPYPSSSDIVDQDIVLSHYDTRANFGAYKTFAMPDKIPVLKEDDLGRTEVEYVDAPEILNSVRQKLTARGYTEVTQASGMQPDLAVGLTAVSSTIEIYGGGYCYYWSYWYWYYPCYPSYTYVSSYKARTFVMDLVDTKSAAANPRPDGGAGPAGIIWSNWLYGVISTSYQFEAAAILQGIDEAFAQSPYVKAGN
ncbi:MAG: DUF4136 domain-containing protein [Myxococcota bacterium]